MKFEFNVDKMITSIKNVNRDYKHKERVRYCRCIKQCDHGVAKIFLGVAKIAPKSQPNNIIT